MIEGEGLGVDAIDEQRHFVWRLTELGLQLRHQVRAVGLSLVLLAGRAVYRAFGSHISRESMS